jgi:pimeloyl-ACP methyl ester carboxylesterase
MARLAIAAVVLFALLGARADAAKLRVGSITLRSCGGAWCGSLSRPLDPARPTGRRIDIFFRWFAGRSDGAPLVAVEGGPGYPSTGSKVEYRGIYGRSLLRSRGLLLVDNRGTGDSALIECTGVQGFAGRTSGRAFARRVGRCAREIEARYGRGASGLFATAYAVDDLAAVIRALRLGNADLYGDSYGTYFAQDFMARHPRMLHTVVLDSAYPRRALGPWYASSGAAARQALEIVSPGAAARLGQLLTRVRTTPITGNTRDAETSELRARVDPRAVADMVQDSASDPVTLRELDASIRAAVAGDDVPILRLAGQSNAWNHSPTIPEYFSRGLYAAVACRDYPVVPDLEKPPDAFQPFTGAEWRSISGFSQPYDICLDWPASKRPPRVPDVKLPASVPILRAPTRASPPAAPRPSPPRPSPTPRSAASTPRAGTAARACAAASSPRRTRRSR